MKRRTSLFVFLTSAALGGVCGCQCGRQPPPSMLVQPPPEYPAWEGAGNPDDLTATMQNVIRSRFWKKQQTVKSVEQLVDYVHGLPSGSVLLMNAGGEAASFQGQSAEAYRTPGVWRMERLPDGFSKFPCLDLDLVDHPNLTKPQVLRLLLTALDSYCVDVQMRWTPPEQSNRYQVDLKSPEVSFIRTDAGDAGLKEFAPSIARLPNRTKVVLSGTKVSDSGLKELAAATHLTDLELDGTLVTAVGLRSLAPLTKLVRLRWFVGDDYRNRVTDEVVSALWETKHLQALECVVYNADEPKRTPGGSATWLSLHRHPRRPEDVNCLDLSRTKVTDRAVKVLPSLPHLIWLDLGRTGVTDSGMKSVGAVRGLVRLDLYGTAVTDAGLKELAGLSNLIHLSLNDTKVTAKGYRNSAGRSRTAWSCTRSGRSTSPAITPPGVPRG